jgi:hypothetical protein
MSSAYTYRRAGIVNTTFDPGRVEMVGFMAIKSKIVGDFSLQIKDFGAFNV